MCLSYLIKKEIPNEGECFKVIKDFGNKYLSAITLFEIEFKTWMKCNSNLFSNSPRYELGFHSFLKLEDALFYKDNFFISSFRKLKIAKCKYKDVLAFGITQVENLDIQCMDGVLETVVSKHIFYEEMLFV